MRITKAILNVCLMLLISTIAHISCTTKNQEVGIQEVDKKYLSESQLFALNQAIENDPENADNYYRRAKVYFERKEYPKALQDIVQAFKLNNTEGRYYLLQAKILEALREYPAAVEAAKTAESFKVNDSEVKILLSKLYLEINDLSKARQYLYQAVRLTPYHPDIFFLTGKIEAINGDTVSAIRNLFTAIKKDTTNIEVYKELSKVYFTKQKFDSAMMFVSIGRAIEPEDPFFYYMEGRFLEHLNMKESSEASYKTSLKLDSSYPEGYKALGMMNYREGNWDIAGNYFEKELKLNPASSGSVIYLSDIYEKQNRGYLAIPLLEKVLKTDSGNVKARAALDRLYVLYPKKEQPAEKADTVISNTIPDGPTDNAPKTGMPIKKVPSRVDTVKKAEPAKVVPDKPDTLNKRPSLPVKVDTVQDKTLRKQGKNNRRKSSDSTKENRFFKRNKNSDSAKIETKKDTVNK